eukprot:TRINITY_DN7825_c0_g1_i1.p1 TRINITY_DN7825_c0_g1~~TRINITY_DN7825_c0_g1_i1.p1  ORF type:complete len:133 (+),score=39.78 TRINITY_DN7825_c0_g1_i1:25-423(+)
MIKEKNNTKQTIKNGDMQIKSNRNLVNWWVDLYGVLDDNILYFYKTKNSSTNEDSINLKDVLTYTVEEEKKIITIETNSQMFWNRQQKFMIYVLNYQDFIKWNETLKSIVNNFQTKDLEDNWVVVSEEEEDD